LLDGFDRADPAKLIESNDLLHVTLEDRPKYHLWQTLVRSIGRSDLAVDRGLVFDSSPLAVQYALSGDGVALADPLLFEDDLRSGRLVRPFDIWVDEGHGYYLSTHPEDLSGEAVAVFRTWLIARFAGAGASLAPTSEPPSSPPRLRVAK